MEENYYNDSAGIAIVASSSIPSGTVVTVSAGCSIV